MNMTMEVNKNDKIIRCAGDEVGTIKVSNDVAISSDKEESVEIKGNRAPDMDQPPSNLSNSEVPVDVESIDSNMDCFKVPNAVLKVRKNKSTPTVPLLTKGAMKSFDEDSDSPEEKLTIYNPPSWSLPPPDDGVTSYKLSEIKSGVIVNEMELTKSIYMIGRSKLNDIVMRHDSISRYHAVLQFGSPEENRSRIGFYLYDLNAPHGTFVNKKRIEAETYFKLEDGFVFKVGCSTRLFVLDIKHSEDDSDINNEHNVSNESIAEKDEGINWGLGEDATEVHDPSANVNVFASSEEQFNDALAAIQRWFAAEHLQPDFKFKESESSENMWDCSLKVPLKEAYSHDSDYTAQGVADTKKEAMKQAATDACCHIAKLGYPISQYDTKKKKDWEKDDFYDSDEDPFFDQTEQLQEKRQKRRRKEKVVEEEHLHKSTKLEKAKREKKQWIKSYSLSKQLRKKTES